MAGHAVAMPVPIGSNLSALANPTYKGVSEYTGAWKDCAYDPELPGPIYHTDQVRVPSELQEVVREWTKAVVREQPDNLNEWSKQWFANHVGMNKMTDEEAEMNAAATKLQAANRGRTARKGGQ
eukprot:5826062-Prymnesium_polylepis.1